MSLSALRAAAVVLGFTLAWANCPSQASTIYEVGADFSSSVNGGTNPWSYGYLTSGESNLDLSTFTKFPTGSGGGTGATGQWTIGMNSDPNVYHNAGAATGNSSFYVAANAVILGPAFGPTVVEWTAPAAGTVDFTSSGQDIQACCGPRTVYYDVFVKGSDSGIGGPQNVGPNPVSVDPSNLPTVTYNQSNISVAPGDVIAFMADGHAQQAWNSMQLNATITFTPVPEPSSILLAGLGGLAGC